MTATTATAAKAVMAVSGTIQKVRTAIAQGGPGVNALCAAVNKCAANKTHRYVLSSVDSVFDGVVLEAAPEGPDAGEPKDVVRTLCKLPRAVYMPRTADVTRPGPDLGALLDKELRKVEETDAPLQEYAAYVQELGETAEFVAEHSIEGFYGPLRPSALRLLNKYKQTLMQQERLGSLRKLTYATQLIHVMKMHSIDSEELADFINAILAKSPNLIKQCSIPTLDVIFKTKLTPEIKEKLDHCLRMTTTTPMGLKEWSELFWMVARNSDNRNTIDCCLQSYKIVARHMNRQDKAAEGNKKAKSVTCSTLMNVVHGVNILQNRLRPSDPVFKSALQVLEAVWPLLEARISKFQSAELIDIAECYFEHHRAVNPQMRHGSRNCLDLLVREFVRRSRELTLRDWVALFEALDRANDAMVVNVLMPKPGNYYVKVAAVQRAWVEDLAQSLRSMPLEELADNVYSLSLPQCSNLCKHLVAAGCYEDPIAATLERRCLTLITDLKYHTTRHVMDFYFVQLQMLLPQQNGLRVVLEGNKPLRDMLGRMSSTNLLRLLSLARCCAPADCRVLLQRLAERVETQTLVLTPQQCASVLKHAARYKDSNLTNAVLAATVPQLLTAAEPHKGFYRMLDLSKFALALPRSDFGDTSPAGLLNELIVQHAPLHVSHLALQLVAQPCLQHIACQAPRSTRPERDQVWNLPEAPDGGGPLARNGGGPHGAHVEAAERHDVFPS
ncbi:pyridoxal phosphate enzyme, YggS family [Babesia caballi]|uniref:Pyridoxal phosphate enzyme, YggS family n=1 Tax=Babesia caballi TaxID=5871 RepID=A0AAV4LU60_BABCB|nr:pyridoxal phosphate enzyme, YggS family [Babesia caballi]